MKLLLIVAIILVIPTTTMLAQDGTMATVTAAALNVRSGPRPDSDVLGQLRQGARLYLSGRSADSAWLYFLFWDKPAWLRAAYVRVEGDISDLPIIGVETVEIVEAVAPATPRIVLSDVTIDPAIPRPGEPFQVQLTLKNEGGDAGIFSIATTFNEGHFAFLTVPSLARGGAGVVTLNCPGEKRTGRFTIHLALDVERQLEMDEVLRVGEITYTIDMPLTAQGSVTVRRYTNLDLHGGRPDIAFGALGLEALEGAQLAVLDMTMSDLHYDRLAALQGSSIGQLDQGQLIGVTTAEGRRGWMRVQKVDGDALDLAFAIYAR